MVKIAAYRFDCDEVRQCLLYDICNNPGSDFRSRFISQLKYPRGQVIFFEEAPTHGQFFILNGKVIIYSTGKNNRKQIMRLAGNGEMIGLAGLFSDTYQVSCKSLEDSTVCFIKKEQFKLLMQEKPILLTKLLRIYSEQIKFYQIRQKHICQLNVHNRVVESLLMILKAFGKKTVNGYLIDVCLTRKELAEIAGTSTEGAIRELHKLRKKGIIEIQYRKILIPNLKELIHIVLNHCCDNSNVNKCLNHLVNINI